MRRVVKKLFCRIGLWYPLVHLRQFGAVSQWMLSGCPSPPPHLVKLRVVWHCCKQFGVRIFVETGTHVGETTEWMARKGIEVISIELSDRLYQVARTRLQRYRNVTLVHGDSARVLPDLLARLSEPACFWLDAHFSGGGTARDALDTPIVEELRAIPEHRIGGHVILVDDACCFTGRDGYPFLDELLSLVRQTGAYEAEVSTDIVRITPRARWCQSNA